MIETTRRDGVALVTLDRPERRNALTHADLDALEAAITGVDPTATPVVCLQGAGPAFCAGADLDVVADLDAAGAREFSRRGQRVARTIEDSEAVVVAGVDGPARGGGVELALACDIRVGTPEASFAETGVRLGLFGAWGGTARLPAVVGPGAALDLALSGRTVDATEARELGLISRVVEDPSGVAGSIAENPADALRTIKGRMRDDGPIEEQEQAEAEAFARLVEAHGRELRDR